MNTLVIVGIVAGSIILLGVILLAMYVKAPPSIAYILSGLRKEPRVLIGTGGFKIPIIERLDKTFLGQISVDVKTSMPVPTHDFIDVMVDAVCKVRAFPTPEGIRLAAKNFLNMTPDQIAQSVKDSLEGNMREVIGAISLQDLVTDRDAFSDQIQKKAARDMEKLGLEILSCNIQNINDKNGLIKDLGADNTYKIKKDAAINKANAEKEIAIAESDAQKAANDVRVKNETEIAERNNELAIRQAVLPQVARSVAEPMSQIGGVTIYGSTGAEMQGVAANVPAVMKQTFDVVKNVTGVDLADVMKAGTIEAKTDRNINVTGLNE